MSHHDTPPAQDIHHLLSQWEAKRGSKGGWWALAGFSFQTAVYLERFFRGVSADVHEPVQLAQMERLSDIFAPDNGYVRLIQVKRTLEKDDLRSALSEAYRIASLCTRPVLERIRFQVVCLRRATPLNPGDISRTEVEGADDSDLWNRTLAQFDPIEPIIEAPDPLDRLHYLLWECGVRDTEGFLDDCRGKLLKAFENPTARGIESLARELASLFHQLADATQPAERLGGLLCREDLAEGLEAEGDHTVVVARRPRHIDLRRGSFRHRDQIFADLVAEFDAWWADVESHSEAEYLPIFWIDGRSGDGKSVLMLQLAQHLLLAQAAPPALVGDLSPDEVPDWIARRADTEKMRRASPQRPILALVDDLHAAEDLEEWDQRLRDATQDHVPRVALLACGPTPEREVFERTCSTRVKVAPFTIPKLSHEEMAETIAWYCARTGKQPPRGIAGAENRLLVVLLFELEQGQSLGDFQKTFRKRLESQRLFVVAREILAVNALELAAPTQILDGLLDSQLDYFRKLCDVLQLHFECVARGPSEPFPGYRFAQIGWRLYQEWAPDYASLAIAWARDVAAVLNRYWSNMGEANFPVIALRRLGNTGRLAEAHSHSRVGSIQEAIAELYRKCASHLRVSMLARWLKYLYRCSDLTLDPDPVQLAFAACGASSLPANVHPSVARWLWRLSETPRFAEHAEDMRRHAQSLLSGDPNRPGTGACLTTILNETSDRTLAERFVKNWLGRFRCVAEAMEPLCRLVANQPQDTKVIAAGLDWVEANLKHDQAYQLLGTLVANRPKDDKVLTTALDWVEANQKHDKAYQLLEALVANQPQDTKVIAAALDWVEANLKHDQAYQLLVTLVANRPKDDKVLTTALDWVEANQKHDKAYQLLEALVANQPQNDNVVQAARNWWNSNRTHPNAYRLLCSLITRSDGAAEWMSAGEAWLTADGVRGKDEVLRALLSGGKAAPRYLDEFLSRLERADSGERAPLLFGLSQVLANNVAAAVAHLRGVGDTERKAVLARALAVGLSRYPNRAEEFVEHLSTTPADYQGLLLAGCIRSDLDGAILDCVLEGWLATNNRRRGYGEVLRALKECAARWQELLERENLAPVIIADFDALSGTRSGKAVDAANRGGSRKKRQNARRRARAKRSSSPE